MGDYRGWKPKGNGAEGVQEAGEERVGDRSSRRWEMGWGWSLFSGENVACYVAVSFCFSHCLLK